MSAEDRRRWDEKWAARSSPGEPSPWVVRVCARWFPTRGRALDIAGGAGRHAEVLARHGLEVTLSDISEVGARIGAGLHPHIHVDVRDLEVAPPPDGPWDSILIYHYMNRPLLARVGELIAPGGVIAIAIATIRNLERHPHPGARYLLNEGELSIICTGFDVLEADEGWNEEGRHEARIVARKPPETAVH